MNKYVIDAYAWIEYFNGSQEGKKVKQIIENEENKSYTNTITIAELASFFKRKQKEFKLAKVVLKTISTIHQIDDEFAEETGSLHANIKKDRKNFGLADAFVLLTAKRLNAKVVTGDQDFEGMKEVLLIK